MTTTIWVLIQDEKKSRNKFKVLNSLIIRNQCLKLIKFRDLPGGPVVKNPPSNAVDVGSIPGRTTEIPHAAGQLSRCAAAAEPTRSGTHVPQLERSPCTTTKDLTCRNEDPACRN